jgi:hypothetical protein
LLAPSKKKRSVSSPLGSKVMSATCSAKMCQNRNNY